MQQGFEQSGYLHDDPEHGIIVVFPFGKTLRRVTKHLIGVELEIRVKPLKFKRSNAQNRWLWGVAYPTIIHWMLETQGERVSKDALHTYVLQVLLEYEPKVTEVMGVTVVSFQGKSTSSLTTTEFTELMDKIVAHWAEKGCTIPLPSGNNFISDHIK